MASTKQPARKTNGAITVPDLPNPDQEQPNDQTGKIPPGHVMMWVNPDLARELHSYYGHDGHALLHDPIAHGMPSIHPVEHDGTADAELPDSKEGADPARISYGNACHIGESIHTLMSRDTDKIPALLSPGEEVIPNPNAPPGETFVDDKGVLHAAGGASIGDLAGPPSGIRPGSPGVPSGPSRPFDWRPYFIPSSPQTQIPTELPVEGQTAPVTENVPVGGGGGGGGGRGNPFGGRAGTGMVSGRSPTGGGSRPGVTTTFGGRTYNGLPPGAVSLGRGYYTMPNQFGGFSGSFTNGGLQQMAGNYGAWNANAFGAPHGSGMLGGSDPAGGRGGEPFFGNPAQAAKWGQSASTGRGTNAAARGTHTSVG